MQTDKIKIYLGRGNVKHNELVINDVNTLAITFKPTDITIAYGVDNEVTLAELLVKFEE